MVVVWREQRLAAYCSVRERVTAPGVQWRESQTGVRCRGTVSCRLSFQFQISQNCQKFAQWRVRTGTRQKEVIKNNPTSPEVESEDDGDGKEAAEEVGEEKTREG